MKCSSRNRLKNSKKLELSLNVMSTPAYIQALRQTIENFIEMTSILWKKFESQAFYVQICQHFLKLAYFLLFEPLTEPKETLSCTSSHGIFRQRLGRMFHYFSFIWKYFGQACVNYISWI